MKGRNPLLILRRNEYLIKRYYYWYELKRLRQDDAINRISEREIFLDEEYIFRLLRNNSHLLKEIKLRKPSERELETFQFKGIDSPAPVQLAFSNL